MIISDGKRDKPSTPLLAWLCEEQADITGRDLAELSGISPQTWSKVRQGKQDLSSDLLWRCMKAISLRRPRGDVARVVDIVEGFSKKKPLDPLLQIELALERLTSEEDRDQALLLISRSIRQSQQQRNPVVKI